MTYIIKYLIFISLLFSSLYAASAKEKVSLQLLWKHQFEFAGFYMAEEKGFYKEAGLDVQIKEYDFNTDIVKDVEKGLSTFGIGYPSIILEKAKGARINVLNSIFQSSPHALAALESSGIKSLKDMKNKRIMINDDAVSTVSFKSMLQSQNISFEDMRRLKHSFNIHDLINNKTDIISIYTSNELYELDRLGIKYNLFDPKDYGFDFYGDLLFTSTKELAQNPRTVESFRKASLKGWRYAFKNIDETVDIIYKEYNTQNKTKEALKYEALKLKELAYYKTSKLGNIDKNKIQRITDIYSLMGLAEKNIDMDEFVFTEDTSRIILTQEEKAFLKSNPVIRVHNEMDYPPFNYNENNTPKGYSIDYMNLLAQKLDLNIKYIWGPTWSQFIQMSKKGEIDVMLNIVNTKSRQEFLTFTTSYKTLSHSIFTNLDNINCLEDLSGKTVAFPKDFFLIEFLQKNYPDIKINIYDDTLQCIYSVLEGKSDALVENFAVINFLLQKHNLSIKNVKINIDKRLDFKLNIGVGKQKAVLRNILQKAIYTVSQEEINALQSKWLGIDIKESIPGKINFTEEESTYLKKKQKIKMCIDPDWMPFEKFDENGKHVGMSADYYKLFEKTIGVDIEAVPAKTWGESLEKAKNRECDIMSLVMETPNRKKFLNFTSPYLEIPLVIATKLDVTFVNDIKSLGNKPIGIPKGYAFVELLKNKYPFLNIIEVENINEGLSKVNEGKLFGYIGTLASVGYMFQTKFTGELKIAGKFNESWRLGIGVRNDDLVLLNIMQKAVDNLTQKEKQKILNDWIAVKYEKKIDYTILWQLLAVISVIALFIIYRQYLLNQANNSLKSAVLEKTKELQELNKNLEKKIQEAVMENSQKDRILFTQSKMAAMGEMLANIAHQWRQPLNVISTVASGIQLKIELDSYNKKETLQNLDSLIDATQYLSQTIDDFKNFLEPNNKNEKFNIKDVIDKNIFMFGKSFKNSDINFVLNTKDLFVYGNQNELIQVIINILNNAKDVLKTKALDKRLIVIDTYKEKENNIITIQDNGGGVDEEIKDKIFDAYFTTKHKTQGTGLGLYMSYQIITNKFKGELYVDNKELTYENKTYSGAKFYIKIPQNR